MKDRRERLEINKLNIGIVGCGWIVEFAHLPALLKNEGVCVKAVFDTDPDRARYIAEKASAAYVFNKFEDFLDCGLDGIIIATPNATHAPYTLEALRRRIGVLCEKPVALKSSEVDEIIKVCKEKRVVYVPGFVNRSRTDIRKMYSVIRDGKIGDIRLVSAGWLRKNGVPRPGTWFTNRRLSGGGVLVDLGSHVIDICLMLLGNKKLKSAELFTSCFDQTDPDCLGAAEWFKRGGNAQFEIDVEKTAIISAHYEDETDLSVKLSWEAPIEADCTYFRVCGTSGVLELKTLFGFSSDRMWKEDTLKISSDGQEEVLHFDMSVNKATEAFERMISDFCSSLRCGKSLNADCFDALKTVDFIERMYLAEKQDKSKVTSALLENQIGIILSGT